MQQYLLDRYTEDNISFAIFKYPNSGACTLVIGEEKILGHNYDLIDQNEAFIISPFDIVKHPIISIVPHKIISDSASLSKYLFCPEINTGIESLNNNDQGGSLIEDKENYSQVFQIFHQAILNQDYLKLVLSRTAEYQTKKDISPVELFQKANSISGAFVYLCHTPSLGTWLGATPELLLEGKDNIWQTVALAGTRSRNQTDQKWDQKNKEEHLYVSDYICSVVTGMGYTTTRQKTETVQAANIEHLKTRISFTKDTISKQSLGQLINLLHPTPAICGLPKKVAFDFIEDNEGYDRSYYSGLVGWVCPSSKTHLYVNLRCMKIHNSHSFQLFAGGGLMPYSDMEQEWLETKAKMNTLLSLF